MTTDSATHTHTHTATATDTATALNHERRLQQVFRDVFGDDTLVITPRTNRDDIPGWDSLGTVSLLYAVEAEFDLEIADDDLATFTSVGALSAYLAKALREHDVSR